MKFTNEDWRAFFLGVASSIAGVLIWDYIKHKRKLLEFKESE